MDTAAPRTYTALHHTPRPRPQADGADWTLRAICTQVDPEIFFPHKGESARPAKNICYDCPVRPQCLTDALAAPWLDGVWAATTERERRHMRRRGLTEPPDTWHDEDEPVPIAPLTRVQRETLTHIIQRRISTAAPTSPDHGTWRRDGAAGHAVTKTVTALMHRGLARRDTQITDGRILAVPTPDGHEQATQGDTP